MDKGLGLIEIGNSVAGYVNLIGKLFLTCDIDTAQDFCQSDKIQIIKTEGANRSK
jgi:hypothetical protein